MISRGAMIRFLLVLALLVSTALFLQAHKGAEVVPQAQKLSTFPLEVGGWSGRDLGLDPQVLDVLKPSDYVTRGYVKPGEPYVDFFIAYFASQRAGDAIHSPKNCLPGSGWTPMESGTITLNVPGHGPIVANRYIISKGQDRQYVIYWYQSHGRSIASEYWAKFYQVVDSMRLNRTDAALVRVITPMNRNEDLSSAGRRAADFAQQAAVGLNRYIPD